MEELEQRSVRQETTMVDNSQELKDMLEEVTRRLDQLSIPRSESKTIIKNNVERVVTKGKDHSNDITSLRSHMDSELERLEAKMNSNHEALMKELANSSFFDELLKELER